MFVLVHGSPCNSISAQLSCEVSRSGMVAILRNRSWSLCFDDYLGQDGFLVSGGRG